MSIEYGSTKHRLVNKICASYDYLVAICIYKISYISGSTDSNVKNINQITIYMNNMSTFLWSWFDLHNKNANPLIKIYNNYDIYLYISFELI